MLRLRRRPTLLLRICFLLAGLICVNLILWVVAVIVFKDNSHNVSLCLLAWTIGLRHALDADHISIIDNATRRIASEPLDPKSNSQRQRRPVTCGLFFSLGHSTIVIVVLCAVSISLGVVNRMHGVTQIGSILGAAFSGSTLFLFAIVNSILLWRSWRGSRRAKANPSNTDTNTDPQEDHRFKGIFTRLAYPLFRLVDRPYKLYPVGVLFGLGFDSTSSIAILGISAATRNPQTPDIHADLHGSTLSDPHSQAKSDASIVVLAFLFTAGMTLVDSLDSILMINAYAPGELFAPPSEGRGWRSRIRFFEPLSDCHHAATSSKDVDDDDDDNKDGMDEKQEHKHETELALELATLAICTDDENRNSDVDMIQTPEMEKQHDTEMIQTPEMEKQGQQQAVSEKPATDLEMNPPVIATTSSTSTVLSHVLTLLSIVLALAISVITLLGLIGNQCARCRRACDKQKQTHNGGLEGRWWLFWSQVNSQSGIIGVSIVALFAACLVGYYLIKYIEKWYKARQQRESMKQDPVT